MQNILRSALAVLLAFISVWSQFANAEPSEDDQSTNDASSPKPALKNGDRVQMPFRTTGRSLGRGDAPLVLVEYANYQCSYCARFNKEVLPKLRSQYIDKGRLRFVVRDFPLDFFPNSHAMAVVARCAEAEGAFWKMNDYLYSEPVRRLRDIDRGLDDIAQATSLDPVKLRSCFTRNSFDEEIKIDGQDAASAGMTGTPNFVLGRVQERKLVGSAIVGAYPADVFEAMIKEQLAKSKK